MFRRSVLLFLTVLGFASFSSAQDTSEGRFEGSLSLTYEKGYVLGWDDARTYSKLTLYRADAKPVYSVSDVGPGGRPYHIWAVDSDGAAARAYHDERFQGRIDVLDASGKVNLTIDTGSYDATRLTFAPDHSIWTVGYIFPNDATSPDFNVVRHYARTGEKLSEALPWSSIAGDHNAYTAMQSMLGTSSVVAANDRIGFVAFANWGHRKWIEVAFSGTLLGQYDLGHADGEGFSPHAMTASGGVYGRIFKDHELEGYGVLDKSKGEWRRVSHYPDGLLIGADGDDLVFSEREGGSRVLHKVPTVTLASSN